MVAAHGLASVTMSRIAEETGIGRATLYKYFSDVEAILVVPSDVVRAARLRADVVLRQDAAGGKNQRVALVDFLLRRHVFGE